MAMYTYPNGQRCNVSEARARLYERIVPYLAVVLALAGLPMAIRLFFDDQHVLRSVMTTMAAWTVWVPSVAVMAFWAFVWWCKPVDGISAEGSEMRETIS